MSQRLRAVAPSMVTMSSVVSACAALTLLLLAPRTAARDVVVALCLGFSMLADLVDGPLARRLGVTSSFGAALDSLADLLAFGVVPAMWVIARYGHVHGLAAVVPAFAWVVAASFRLARFVDDTPTAGSFVGVPTTAAAGGLLVAMTVSIVSSAPAVAMFALVVGAALMASRVAYPKGGWGRWSWVVLVPAATGVLIFAAAR